MNIKLINWLQFKKWYNSTSRTPITDYNKHIIIDELLQAFEPGTNSGTYEINRFNSKIGRTDHYNFKYEYKFDKRKYKSFEECMEDNGEFTTIIRF